MKHIKKLERRIFFRIDLRKNLEATRGLAFVCITLSGVNPGLSTGGKRVREKKRKFCAAATVSFHTLYRAA